MKAIKVVGTIDERHQLHADVPEYLPPGPVRILILLSDEDVAAGWTRFVAKKWSAELADPTEDIYVLEDGRPIDSPPSGDQ